MNKKPFLLCIMDGVGESEKIEGNAVHAANTPTLDRLRREYPHSQLRTDGPFVGLPEGQMGNSECGHITIGSGRIIQQSLERIFTDIESGALFNQPGYKDFMAGAKDARAIHLLGMLSDGGVHSHTGHALGLCKELNKLGKPIFIHAIADGRDVPMRSGLEHFKQFQADIAPLKNVHLATISGRFYAMDRDKRWERMEEAWRLFTELKGTKFKSSDDAFQTIYDTGKHDEFVQPSVIEMPAGLDARIQDGDALFLFNFRADRMRQIMACFLGLPGVGFTFAPPKLTAIATMTSYDETFVGPHVIYPPETHRNALGEVLDAAGKTQLRIAETEKYPHVTFYLNAGREEPYKGEDRILVPSPKEVKSYDLKPQMSLPEVTDKLVEAILSSKYDFIGLNIANGDLVGHTGVFEAVVKAVEAVDTAVGKILAAIRQMGGEALVIADHGNSEEMILNGQISTSHSTNPVPCFYVGPRKFTIHNGGLADVAPTILTLMGLPVPKEMIGKSLVK